MKNTLLALIVLGSTLVAFASRKDEVTLVLIPREDGAVRVGLDLASRFPTLLVSYKVGANGTVSLHGWDGRQWVNIDSGNFLEGDFFRTGPESALIVEDAGYAYPDNMLPPEDWCDSVYKITTAEIRPLLHLIGKHYEFTYDDWKWFSTNYKMSLEAINPEGLNVSWYHKRLSDNMKSMPVAADDLQFWVPIRYPEPVITPVEEPMVEEETVITNVVEDVEQPEMEIPDDPVLNPLTNDAPEAVVMGAETAVESNTNLVEDVEIEIE